MATTIMKTWQDELFDQAHSQGLAEGRTEGRSELIADLRTAIVERFGQLPPHLDLEQADMNTLRLVMHQLFRQVSLDKLGR